MRVRVHLSIARWMAWTIVFLRVILTIWIWFVSTKMRSSQYIGIHGYTMFELDVGGICTQRTFGISVSVLGVVVTSHPRSSTGPCCSKSVGCAAASNLEYLCHTHTLNVKKMCLM